jgi:small GTP-binding protein
MADGADQTAAQERTRFQEGEAAVSANEADSLSHYRRHKLELAELIRTLMSVAAERRDDEKRGHARDLLASLAEDAFQLAVVGQFSRGKSTLMNAILGRSYLPTGALPMTSVVTTVRYGSRPRAVVERVGSTYPFERPLDELARFVAQASLEREELRVASALVEVPAEILRLGFSFVDTPGVGSAIEANTATTESFLPQADAVIFVTSFDAPLSEAELEFLAKVRSYVDKLFLVVNKRDLVSSSEAETVLAYVRERVDADGGLRLFATSAKQALDAKERSDHAAVATSGLPELEQELVRFLTTEKSRVFLQQVTARAERLLSRQRLELELGRHARFGDNAEQGVRRERFDAAIENIVATAGRSAADLRDRIHGAFPQALAERSQAWPPELSEIVRRRQTDRQQQAAGSPRRQLTEAVAATLAAAEAPLETWMRQRATEARALLLQLAETEIEALQRSRQSLERVAAEAFDLPVNAESWAEAPGTPADLPQLAVRVVALRVDAKLPWWLALIPAARLTNLQARQLSETLDATVASYRADVKDALVDAADRWAEMVGSQVEEETRRAVENLRERLRLPGSERHLQLLFALEQRFHAFAATVASWEPSPSAAPAALDLGPTVRSSLSAIAPCVICRRIAHIPFDFLADVQYELATREQSRKANAAQGGFCALHTWQYAELGSDLGIALTYAEVAAEASRQLRTAIRDDDSSAQLRELALRFTPGSARCPVCRAVAAAQEAAIVDLIEILPASPEESDAPPLCIPHLAAVLAADPNPKHASRFGAHLARELARVAEDMSTYALKRESMRRHLMNEDERASYLAAVARLAAFRELVRPWRNDDEDRVL